MLQVTSFSASPSAWRVLGLQLTQHVDLAQAVCESLVHSCQIPIVALTNSHRCSGLTQQRCMLFTVLWVRIPVLLSLGCHQGVCGIALFSGVSRGDFSRLWEPRSLVLQDQGPCPLPVSPRYACQLLAATLVGVTSTSLPHLHSQHGRCRPLHVAQTVPGGLLFSGPSPPTCRALLQCNMMHTGMTPGVEICLLPGLVHFSPWFQSP